MAAALNRSTLVSSPNQPDAIQGGANNYYKTNPTNHYARIVHSVNLDGRGYAFPYDDVVPSGATGPDQAGTVSDGSPALLTVTVGGPSVAGSADKGEGKDVVGDVDVSDGEKKKKKTKENREKKAPFGFAASLKRVMSVLKGVFHK